MRYCGILALPCAVLRYLYPHYAPSYCFRIQVAFLDTEIAQKYKNHALEWNLNKLYLHGFLDFANVRIFPTTRLALSWDQALLSFSWVNRFPFGKANRKVSYLVQYLCTWITCTWLLHHLHLLSGDYCHIRRTLNSTPGPSRPYTMHISRYNTGIPRMWTVLGITLIYG